MYPLIRDALRFRHDEIYHGNQIWMIEWYAGLTFWSEYIWLFANFVVAAEGFGDACCVEHWIVSVAASPFLTVLLFCWRIVTSRRDETRRVNKMTDQRLLNYALRWCPLSAAFMQIDRSVSIFYEHNDRRQWHEHEWILFFDESFVFLQYIPKSNLRIPRDNIQICLNSKILSLLKSEHTIFSMGMANICQLF